MTSRPDREQSPSPPDLSSSQLTIPSDSEPYSSLSPPSSSPPQSSNNNGEQPVILYQPPTIWSIVRGAAINLLLPFVNGMMLGFGELLAHEWAFRLGWSETNVSIRMLEVFMMCQESIRQLLRVTSSNICHAGLASTQKLPPDRSRRRDARRPDGTEEA